MTRTALITGATSGFGAAAVRRFVAAGWRVIATMRTPRNDVLTPSDRLRILPLDVTKGDSIRAAFEAACARRGDRHDAMHDALECLGEMLFNAQRNGTPPDGAAYVSALRKRGGLAV